MISPASPAPATLAAVDVCYHDAGATAAALSFRQWHDAKPDAQFICQISDVAAYEPGMFYKRELPCLLSVLRLLPHPPEIVIVDGHAWLRPGEPGLGWHLHAALGIPVIGVAKTSFDQSSHAAHVFRGESQRPVYVTSIGIAQDVAARHISSMYGAFRLPTLLKLVDHLCRTGGPNGSKTAPLTP